MQIMNNQCNICPRKCNIDRLKSKGFCGADNKIHIARAALHHWEEPCISGGHGSGTIFFCGCNLKCVYCQNIEISRCKNNGDKITEDRLAQICYELKEKGAHNINLVTPTHYLSQIKNVLSEIKSDIGIPIVYNCGGYELADSLYTLDGLVDIYLTDIKYMDNALAKKYSLADNYFDIAVNALSEMIRQTGKPTFDKDGLMQKGVIVRHLVLPSHRKDSIEILKYLKTNYGTDKFILSLMSQFTPNDNLSDFPEINRKITSFEYNSVTDCAYDLGFTNAYIQKKSSAVKDYTPPFDLTGV